MNKPLITALLLLLVVGVSAQVLTCHDIQYTENPSGDSPYAGQTVTVQGIVTAERLYTGTSATNYGFVISDPEGGPWSGLLIFTNRYFPNVGDLVEVSGTIVEYYGLTEMSPTTSYQVISSGNPLPAPSIITTAQLASADAEQWECCFVRVENGTITSMPDSFNVFKVNNSTAACAVDDQCFDRTGFSWPSMALGQVWERIQGVVDYHQSTGFKINPRNMQDIIQESNIGNATISIPTVNGTLKEAVQVAVNTSKINLNWYVSSFTTTIKIDPNRIKYQGVTVDETTVLSYAPEVEISAAGDLITFSYLSQEPIVSGEDEKPLFYMMLEPQVYGEALIEIDSFKYENTQLALLYHGSVITKIGKNIAYLNISRQDGPKNIFNPEMGEKITIEYGCKTGTTGVNTKAIVRIYDAQGRLVSTPVNKTIASSFGVEKVLWDGRDTNMRLLPAGLYYCHLEVIDRSSGAKEKTVQPIVIKTKLK